MPARPKARSLKRPCSSSPTPAPMSMPPRARSRFRSTAGRARRRCGCTWACSARAACCWTTMGNLPPPPYQLTDNDYSLLDVTDLVFIDPVSTGYSRAVPGEKAKAVPPPSRKTSNRSATSSACIPRATNAGRRRSSSLARATAPPAPRGLAAICKTATACTSTASC